MLLEEEKLENIRETSDARGRGTVRRVELDSECSSLGGERWEKTWRRWETQPRDFPWEEGVGGGERALRLQRKAHSVPPHQGQGGPASALTWRRRWWHHSWPGYLVKERGSHIHTEAASTPQNSSKYALDALRTNSRISSLVWHFKYSKIRHRENQLICHWEKLLYIALW